MVNSTGSDSKYPMIDDQTINKFRNVKSRFPTNKNVSAGGQIKYVNVTQIFDESTQITLKNLEYFFKKIVREKMYWTREILNFFGIKNEDINIFLNIHQVYKFALTKKVSLRSFSNMGDVTDRTGSYWARQELHGP